MQPIQTTYKGYRFRSRLEARWAVFFDALGLEWAYEKEGFDLDGRWYLPDFWIPYEYMKERGWGFWVEIKPVALTAEESRLLGELARITGHRSFGIAGQPWPGEHRISVYQHHHHSVPERVPLVSDGELVEVYSCKETIFDDGDESIRDKCHDIDIEIIESSKIVASFPTPISFRGGSPGTLRGAFRSARSARFEHGESPVAGR